MKRLAKIVCLALLTTFTSLSWSSASAAPIYGIIEATLDADPFPNQFVPDNQKPYFGASLTGTFVADTTASIGFSSQNLYSFIEYDLTITSAAGIDLVVFSEDNEIENPGLSPSFFGASGGSINLNFLQPKSAPMPPFSNSGRIQITPSYPQRINGPADVAAQLSTPVVLDQPGPGNALGFLIFGPTPPVAFTELTVTLSAHPLPVDNPTVPAVPLPAGMWLLIAGLGTLASFVRRSR